MKSTGGKSRKISCYNDFHMHLCVTASHPERRAFSVKSYSSTFFNTLKKFTKLTTNQNRKFRFGHCIMIGFTCYDNTTFSGGLIGDKLVSFDLYGNSISGFSTRINRGKRVVGKVSPAARKEEAEGQPPLSAFIFSGASRDS